MSGPRLKTTGSNDPRAPHIPEGHEECGEKGGEYGETASKGHSKTPPLITPWGRPSRTQPGLGEKKGTNRWSRRFKMS